MIDPTLKFHVHTTFAHWGKSSPDDRSQFVDPQSLTAIISHQTNSQQDNGPPWQLVTQQLLTDERSPTRKWPPDNSLPDDQPLDNNSSDNQPLGSCSLDNRPITPHSSFTICSKTQVINWYDTRVRMNHNILVIVKKTVPYDTSKGTSQNCFRNP